MYEVCSKCIANFVILSNIIKCLISFSFSIVWLWLLIPRTYFLWHYNKMQCLPSRRFLRPFTVGLRISCVYSLTAQGESFCQLWGSCRCLHNCSCISLRSGRQMCDHHRRNKDNNNSHKKRHTKKSENRNNNNIKCRKLWQVREIWLFTESGIEDKSKRDIPKQPNG